MITTVIFDLDDTLYDEIDFCRSGFRAVARSVAALSDHCPEDRVFDAIWQCFIDGNRGSTFDRALANLGIPFDPPLIGRLVEVYRTHRPTLTLAPETRDTLDELRSHYTLGLLTDGYLPTQRLKVQALGIEHYFKAILYTEELGREHWKPSALGFEKLLKELAARPQEAAYVADNETKDFIAPNQLAMFTVQLMRPSRLHREPAARPEAASRVKIDRIDKLAKVLAAF